MAPFPILIAALIVRRVLAKPVMVAISRAAALCSVLILVLMYADGSSLIRVGLEP